MILRFHKTKSIPGLDEGDEVILYAKVLQNDLIREELTVELFSKTDQYAAIIKWDHADKTRFDAFYDSFEEDD